MPDGHRRSRTGWADTMEDGPPDPPAHTHRLPPLVRAAVLGLSGAVLCLLVAVGLLATYVYQQQQYIQGRGEFRDAETARQDEDFRRGICDLLDQLPEGGLLDRPRNKYGCGPGVPFDQLTPEEQARVSGATPPTVAPTTPSAPSGPAPVVGDPASPNALPAPDPVLPPREEPTAGPLAPVNDLVCETTGMNYYS